MPIQSVSSKKMASRASGCCKNVAPVMVVAGLHGLMWSSLYVFGSSTYIIAAKATTRTTLPSLVLMTAAAWISICYVALHHTAAYTSATMNSQGCANPKSTMRWLANLGLRLTLITWLMTCGLSITFTLARQLSCLPLQQPRHGDIDAGHICVIHRSSVAAELLALVPCCGLFILMQKMQDPFRCHLLGISKTQALLPLVLPYKTSLQRAKFSEMSFKCRSSISLSSHTLVPSFSDSRTTLLPSRSEKAVGLGIYTPPGTSTRSFLAPRPSLSSIRSQTPISSVPQRSPLPPLPAYFPTKYRYGRAIHTAVHPPRRPPRPEHGLSDRTVRIVPPSPRLSASNLAALNKNRESLSSVYSRSISGESHDFFSQQRPGALKEGSRSGSSSSTATVKKSRLGAMRLATDLESVVMPADCLRSLSKDSTEDIDDAKALQARLPNVKFVSDFGDIEKWANSGHCVASNNYGSSQLNNRIMMRQKPIIAIDVRKTRGTVNPFRSNLVQLLV